MKSTTESSSNMHVSACSARFGLDRGERVAWGSGRHRGACQLEPCWNLSPCYVPPLEPSYTTNLGGFHHPTSRGFASFSSSGGELYTTLQVPGRIGWLHAVYRQTRWMKIRVHNHSEIPHELTLHACSSRDLNTDFYPAHFTGNTIDHPVLGAGVPDRGPVFADRLPRLWGRWWW